MKSALVALIIGLATVNGSAQGTMLFTWHGQSNFFQASFEVTAAEMLPGSIWTSDTFSNSITITSLSGATYHNDSPSDYAAGGTYANGTGPYFSMALLNFGTSTEVLVSSALIHERPFSGETFTLSRDTGPIRQSLNRP